MTNYGNLASTFDLLIFFRHAIFALLNGPAVDIMKQETTVILCVARIDMFRGSMRLAVNKWGRIETTEPADFIVKEDDNLSLVEYELVDVLGD